MSSGNQMVDGLMADEDHDARYGEHQYPVCPECGSELDNFKCNSCVEEYLAEERN